MSTLVLKILPFIMIISLFRGTQMSMIVFLMFLSMIMAQHTIILCSESHCKLYAIIFHWMNVYGMQQILLVHLFLV